MMTVPEAGKLIRFITNAPPAGFRLGARETVWRIEKITVYLILIF